MDLAFSYFLILIFIFLFLELRVRVSDDITQSHNAWKDVEDSRRSDIIQHVHRMYINLMSYIWYFRVGCTVASTDHVDRYIR